MLGHQLSEDEMSITVKCLIAELEKIENKLLEVEVLPHQAISYPAQIDRVKHSSQNKKVFIITGGK